MKQREDWQLSSIRLTDQLQILKFLIPPLLDVLSEKNPEKPSYLLLNITCCHLEFHFDVGKLMERVLTLLSQVYL
ncbi:hypothetical protein ILYODFUR_015919 [Ilyodon furcidens]|uniref:Uncharacterized protein n=1 Tax=Ilyodon furcidens TaxID=33524 RepID=A0ABV0UWA9_9TELE